MKIENLTEGMIIKNYKGLCDLLGVEPKPTGNPKTAQLKEFVQFFDFCKVEGSQQLMITKIHDTLKDKTDLRKLGSRSKYINEIGDILVNYLYEQGKVEDKYSTTLSLGQTLEVLGMVNKSYSIGLRHKRETAEVLDMNIFSVHYFFNNTRSEFRKIIERALNNLSSRRVLNWNKCIMICEKDGEDKTYRKADKQEEESIINAEKKILEHLNVRNMQELLFGGKQRKFNKLVKERLPSKWLFYFYAYDLTIGDEAIKIERRLIEQSRKALNKKSKDKAIRLLKAEEGKDEYKLIELLIDLLKYDLEISDAIQSKYELNCMQRFAKAWAAHDEFTNKISKIEYEFNGDIEMCDYFSYVSSSKN